uniref:Ig-like domain-containing protein n=1 Tax=Oncorhynchus tshawytscha TaxID=74940 RepID=A0A8C8ENA9_ONCTS
MELIAGEHITSVQHEVIKREHVTLRCSYDTSSEYPLLYWYRHYSNQAPQFLLYKGARSWSSEEHIPDKRYTSTTSQTSTELVITSVTLADTALYYCAAEMIHSDTMCIRRCTKTCRPKMLWK